MEKQLTAFEWYIENLRLTEIDYLDDKITAIELDVIIDNLVEKAKEMDNKQKYSIDFIMWYSGMNQQQIENAHKRWIKETFKSE